MLSLDVKEEGVAGGGKRARDRVTAEGGQLGRGVRVPVVDLWQGRGNIVINTWIHHSPRIILAVIEALVQLVPPDMPNWPK
jgi:hypothetical protein